MQHHAIVVTCAFRGPVEEARAKAVELGCVVTSITDERAAVNGIRSFMVAPDGSKEGWAESEAGDTKRATFVDWLQSRRHEDGSSPYAWVEVTFGEDGAFVIASHGECSTCHGEGTREEMTSETSSVREDCPSCAGMGKA